MREYELLGGEVDISYPCFIINESFDKSKHKLIALKGLLKPKLGASPDYKVYLSMNSELNELGGILQGSVEALIKLVSCGNIELWLDKDNHLVGDKVYILSL